jgi:hypothetical protein
MNRDFAVLAAIGRGRYLMLLVFPHAAPRPDRQASVELTVRVKSEAVLYDSDSMEDETSTVLHEQDTATDPFVTPHVLYSRATCSIAA